MKHAVQDENCEPAVSHSNAIMTATNMITNLV